MSFGEELRRERELRKISLREIAESTKISVRYLDALERNDFDVLPGGVFNRGFVRAYAQHIGVDPEAMVNAYLLEERAQRERRRPEEQGLLRGPLGTQVEEAKPAAPARRRLAAWIAGAGIVLIAGVGAGFWWWGSGGATPGGGSPAEDGRASGVSPARVPDTTAPKESVPPAAPARGPVELYLERATRGRVQCDGGRIEILNGMPAGSRLRLDCRRELIVDAEDAGALVWVRPDGSRRPLGEDGQPVRGLRVPLADRAP